MTSPEEKRIDSAAVAALYLEHADELQAFLVGALRDGDLAAEALQATFARAMEAGHTAREETQKGWLFRVAYNEAMALRRKQGVENRNLRKFAWIRTGEQNSPEEHVARRETVSRVKQALQFLPEEQRQVVQMRIYEEKTFAVIAEELDLPLGTVLTRMRLALRKLADRMELKETQ